MSRPAARSWSRRAAGRLLAILPAALLLRRPAAAAAATDRPSTLLTIFLRHDESKTLDEIDRHLKETGWYDKFPPAGVEIVSWYVMMGIGQVVVLRVPPDRLRDVNQAVETAAWGGFRTEFYPTYDYRAAWEQAKRDARD